MGSFVVGITPTGNRLCKEFVESLATNRQPPNARIRPDVLLIEDSPSDERSVALTIAPRGYNLIQAKSMASALERLHQHANRINLIVLDSRLPEVRCLEDMARLASPWARVVTLDAKHTTTDLAGLLLDNIQN
jgi:CheY-like chemotaxis protein